MSNNFDAFDSFNVQQPLQQKVGGMGTLGPAWTRGEIVSKF